MNRRGVVKDVPASSGDEQVEVWRDAVGAWLAGVNDPGSGLTNPAPVAFSVLENFTTTDGETWSFAGVDDDTVMVADDSGRREPLLALAGAMRWRGDRVTSWTPAGGRTRSVAVLDPVCPVQKPFPRHVDRAVGGEEAWTVRCPVCGQRVTGPRYTEAFGFFPSRIRALDCWREHRLSTCRPSRSGQSGGQHS